MEVVNAVVPNTLAGTQPSVSGTPVNPGSPALAKGASLATAGLVVAGTGATVPSAAIDSAAAGLLFGMVLAQLAVVKEAEVKEADTEAADVSQTQAQPSPDQISMLASLVPALVTIQVAPQAITMPRETSAAELSGISRPGTQASSVQLNASNVTAEPVLSTDLGKDLKAGQRHNQGPVLDRTLPGTPAPTPSVVLPLALTQDQEQSVQTFMTPVPSAAEVDNQSETAAVHDAGFNAASLSALAKTDKSPDRSSAALPASLLVDAMPTNMDKNRNDLLKGLLEDTTGSVLELAPVVSDKIPTEFIAGRSSSPAPVTEGTAPQATAVVSTPAALPTITPRETIRLDLGPSDLGRVTVQVSVQSQQVQATVGVEHRGLGEFLAAGHVVLDQAMRQHGLRLEELHVESLVNPDMLGPGDGRTGFLDHGQSREDAPGSMRESQARQGSDSEAIMANADHILEPLSGRYRINLFA